MWTKTLGDFEMTIGEALKEEQDRLGITEAAMVEGIMSKSAYSRVIHNQRNISSDLLISILFKNRIDIVEFFKKVKITYSPNNIQLEDELSKRIAIAVNNHKVKDVITCYELIKNADVSDYLKKRAKIAVAVLKNNLGMLDTQFKDSILNDLNQTASWVFNVETLKLFSSAIIVLPKDRVELAMSFMLKKINKVEVSEEMTERYASICDNYLHWKYEQTKNNKPLAIHRNVELSINYLRNLKSSPHTLIYIISAEYYYALFTDNINRAKKIKGNLIDLGCTLVVNNWPV